MIATALSVGSVLKKNSSRWVPSRSRTNTQRIGTSPAPDLYQCPVRLSRPTRRVPPPYQATERCRSRRASAAACRGLGNAAPLTRGRPLPLYGGGGSNRLASGCSLLTGVLQSAWLRRQNRQSRPVLPSYALAQLDCGASDHARDRRVPQGRPGRLGSIRGSLR